ncbi:MAG: tRNA 4-thiouridine(8) synthase ThiI [Bacillota bacterium]
MTRALALTSGGLDSILAAKLIEQQNIEVIGICFKSAFFGSANAENMAQQIGLKLIVVDFTEEHLQMVKNPKNGYGKNMNPCIDCHAMMFRHAGRMMKELEADFLVTGEVLNQRPMSQNRRALDIVLEESGYKGRILRPLCALNLPETEMEKSGLVDRSKLMGISGKSRRTQMELAKQLGIENYPTPAGGCLLTEPQFSDRLRDVFAVDKEDIDPVDIELLKLGRHFRLSDKVKVISTRTQEEYMRLRSLIKDGHVIFNAADYHGSTVLVITKKGHEPTENDIKFAAGITARYSKGRENKNIVVKYKKRNDTEHKYVTVSPMNDDDLKDFLI